MRTRGTALTLEDWQRRAPAARDPWAHEAASDVIDTLFGRPSGLAGAMRRFGATLGADGRPAHEVVGVVRALGGELRRRQRRQVLSTEAIAALMEGWADGFVRGAHAGVCVDPLTGAVTPDVLRLRLQEVTAQCAVLGVSPAAAYQLVLVDVGTGHISPFDADFVLVRVVEEIRRLFDGGETIARRGDRMIVLAPRTAATEHRAALLQDRLLLDGAARWADPCVVCDELPDGELSERYVAELTA